MDSPLYLQSASSPWVSVGKEDNGYGPRSAGTPAGLTCSALPVLLVFPVSFALTFASRLDSCFVWEPMCPCMLIRRRTTPAPTAAPEPAAGCRRAPPSPSSVRNVNFGVLLYRTALLRGITPQPPSRSGTKINNRETPAKSVHRRVKRRVNKQQHAGDACTKPACQRAAPGQTAACRGSKVCSLRPLRCAAAVSPVENSGRPTPPGTDSARGGAVPRSG